MIDKRQLLNECKQIDFGKLSYEDVIDMCIKATEDDMAELQKLRHMVELMEKNNSNTSLCDYYNREEE